jgi:hypothetical protein
MWRSSHWTRHLRPMPASQEESPSNSSLTPQASFALSASPQQSGRIRGWNRRAVIACRLRQRGEGVGGRFSQAVRGDAFAKGGGVGSSQDTDAASCLGEGWEEREEEAK